MRPIEELTMYTYGLLDEHEEAALKSHVESCSPCAEQIRRLRSERRIFERAASAESAPEAPANLLPARPRRPGQAALIAGLAAAALLGVLAWLLSQPPHPGGPAQPVQVAQSSGDDIDRLVAELRSSSALRREIAALALKAYGKAALQKLETAKADPALIDACRGITPEDRAIQKKLKEIRVTIDMENAPLTAIVDYIREVSHFNFHITGIDQPDQVIISFKAQDMVLEGALSQMLESRELSYRVSRGVVIVTTQADARKADASSPPALVPIRVSPDEATVRGYVSALGSDAPLERDQATASLLRLGLSAEPTLWKALDSPYPEVRARVSDLLRQLYDPRAAGPRQDADRRLDEIKPNLVFDNTKLSEILGSLGDSLRLPIVVIPEGLDMNRKVTFRVRDLIAKNCLKLLLAQFALDYLIVDDAILILKPGAPIVRTPRKPVWTAPEEVKRIEAALQRIASEDTLDIHRICKAEDLDAILQASQALEGAAARRCRRAAALLAEDAHLWLIDQASGADVQKPTESQLKILNTEVKLLENDTPDTILNRYGLRHSLKAPTEMTVRAYGAGLRLSSLLKALTRPQGHDFYLEGETLVIDTSANVRAAVEK
jgi:hypothetical protein